MPLIKNSAPKEGEVIYIAARPSTLKQKSSISRLSIRVVQQTYYMKNSSFSSALGN